GKVLDLPSAPTLSDGTAGGLEPESLTFAPCRDLVDEWALLSEDEIRSGLRFLLEKHYLMVEGAAALSVAALRREARRWAEKSVVLVLCGRKLGLETLRGLIKE
ncbi:MAG: pyridoxal-phosphate dependent enzyme, partial [Bacteroidetes bacterium]